MRKSVFFKIALLFWIASLVIIFCNNDSFAADGETYVWFTWCTKQVPTVETPFDIDFWSFAANEVYGQSHENTWAIVSGHATPHSSNIPSIPTPWYYLVVVDVCAAWDWHADLLASSLSDQDEINNVTAAPISSDQVGLESDGTLYFLNTSPDNGEVSANGYPIKTPLSSALQLMQRDHLGPQIPGIFWVKPDFFLDIPAFQQPDRYEGTITRTVIYY